MIVLRRPHTGRNITWRIALLPLLAIVATVAVELALGGGHVSPGPAAVAAAPPAPGAVAVPPLGTKGAVPFSAPAGVAVHGTNIYISDVATNTICSRDLQTGAETLIA